jgi:hypothetical protein
MRQIQTWWTSFFLAAAMSIRNGADEASQNMRELPTQRKW